MVHRPKTYSIAKIMIIGIFLSCSFQIVLAQDQQPIDNLIDKINENIQQYEGISPFDDFRSLKEFGLTFQEIQGSNEEFEPEDFTSNRDSASAFILINYYLYTIIAQLNEIIDHEDYLKYDISNLISMGDLSIIKSKDGKLYNFSISEKTGGTYRSKISWMYYTGLSSQNTFGQNESQYNPYQVFTGDGFDNIYTIPTSKGTKYILTSYVRGCSWCFDKGIMLVKFENGKFIREFDYGLSSRDPQSTVSYDSKGQTINVQYVTDDLTPFCSCGNEEEIDDTSEEIGEKECTCLFKFDGRNFQLENR